MTDAEAIAGRVPNGGRVLLVGDRGPDGGTSQVVAEVCKLVASRANVTEWDGTLPAVHALKQDERFDVVVLATCRCVECTVVATTLYARHVASGGHLALLDTNPNIDWVGWWQGHGPKTRMYGVATRTALARMEILDGVHARWRVECDHFDPSGELGGVIILNRRF